MMLFRLNIYVSGSIILILLHVSLNAGKTSNEVFFEGCMKRENVQNIDEGFSTLGLILVISLSSTKVKICVKKGPAIPKSFNRAFRFRDQMIARNADEAVCFKTTSKVNTFTESDLMSIRGRRFYQKTINSKRGNLGKGIELNFNVVAFEILGLKSKDTVLCLYFYLRLFLNIVSFNLSYSSTNIQVYDRIHGGKISEKANALSNVKDTINYVLRDKCIIKWPRDVHIGQKLNSRCLKENFINSKRYYSSVKDKSKITLKKIKRQLKDNSMFAWPDNKTLGQIRKEVFKQQLELINLADIHGLCSQEVYKKQKILFNSLFFKIIAIDKLSKSNGAEIPGVDNIKLTSYKKDKNLYFKLLESLNHKIKRPNTYKTSPVKRVWVSKSSGKLRPLIIPTIEDRALQYLLNLILEPLVEVTGEPHSFGFRPYRSAKYAIAYLRLVLKTKDKETVKKRASKSNVENQLYELLPENKVILDADIKGFFDNINHDWILNNLFLDPNLILFIKAWLKSGVLDKNIFYETQTGTPQGGIISPTLANFTLNGLEKTVMDSIKPLTKSKEKRIVVSLKDGSKTRIASALAYVRYADDFVVLARSKYIMNNYVIPSINKFLKPRGLMLNHEKTKIFRLSDENMQLDFLGYTFKYNHKWSIKRHIFYSRHAGSRGIALYPNKEKVNNFINKIKFIFKKSNNLDAYNLIAKLNPVLRGWSNYYNLANSSHYRSTVRNAVYRLTWKWASRKHRRWGRKLIAKTYFLTKDLDNDESTSPKAESYKKFKNTIWVFRGVTKHKSRYNSDKTKTIYLVDVTNITQLLSSKHYILPKNLLNIHGYSPDYMRLITFSTDLKFKSAGVDSSFKQRLLNKQNNLCTHCGEPFTLSDSFYGDAVHIHHIKPTYKGGSSNSITNMVLLHSWCHYDIDHRNESA